MELPLTVVVSVRSPNGMPLESSSLVKFYSNVRSVNLVASTQEDSSVTFLKVTPGDYVIEVSAPGYKRAEEQASVMGFGGTYKVYVYLRSESEDAASGAAPGTPVMTPNLQKELNKGLEELRSKRYDEARKHLEKAAKMAPGNPDVQYLLGVLEYSLQNPAAARTKFEAAISLYPSHERALISLGELQLNAGENAAAAQTLEKVLQINAADWRMQLQLANAYLRLKENEKARTHAERAAELAGAKSGNPRAMLGQILLLEGKRDDARRAFEIVIRDFPKEPVARVAAERLEELNKPAAAAAPPAGAPLSLPTAPPPVAEVRPWAPADIDSKVPGVATDVACSEEELVGRVRARMLRQLGNFERFTATEHIEHQEIDPSGMAGPVRARDFDYIVLVVRSKKYSFILDEKRDSSEVLDSFPTTWATRGLVALALNVFHPIFASDFRFSCEGLSQWRGQATWQMRFEQRQDRPSEIRIWKTKEGRFEIPLKGRVWVAANSFDVLHLETDLLEPVSALQLNREHLAIDYGPVKFEHGKTELWLPWYAEMFMEIRGKRFHHRHTLTNYMLFSVDTSHTIAAPKDPEKEP